jgi:F-type H+-transporting ATPase subunit gamma
MANIKDLKKKIRSTKGTLKITTAMKLVSAAKLSKAQQAITNSRPYANELQETINTVSALVENYTHDFLQEREGNKTALLVISSNKGLCGGYNSQLGKRLRIFLAESGEDTKVFFVGKKVRDLVKKEVNEGKFYEFEKSEATYDDIKKVADELAEQFKLGEFSKIKVLFNKFESAISFESTVTQLLPMTLSEDAKKKLEEEFPFDFKYDPDAATILDSVIPEVYSTTIFTSLLDANASEHGSRMAAMDSAFTNCKDMIKTLTLKMNKLRQASITTELIEVVSGAESLKG